MGSSAQRETLALEGIVESTPEESDGGQSAWWSCRQTVACGSLWTFPQDCFGFLSLRLSASFMVAWPLVGSPVGGDVLDRTHKRYPVPDFFCLILLWFSLTCALSPHNKIKFLGLRG